MTQKHTQGPWYVTTGMYGELTVDNGPKDWKSEFPIATIQGPLNDKQANANLIAAAPELLEACKNALQGCRSMGWSVADEIEAAIAKAEGKKQ